MRGAIEECQKNLNFDLETWAFSGALVATMPLGKPSYNDAPRPRSDWL